jgi:hypothetical protein
MSDSRQNQGAGQSTDASSQEPDSDKTASDASDASHYKNPYGVFNGNIESVVNPPSCDTEDKDKSSSESSTEQFVSSADQDSNLSNKFINSDSNTLDSRYNEQSSFSSLNNIFVENNDKVVDIIISKSSAEYNNNNQLSKSASSSVNTIIQKICQNTPYTSLKSDASDASDASSATRVSQNLKTKAEKVGLPEIPCMYCNFRDCIEFDLSIHYVAKHRQQLVRLPIGKSSIDARADYAVELSKKKFAESFGDNDDDRDDDDENEIDE